MNKSKLSVIGLGKLGAGTAACFAAKGFQVIGVDLDPAIVDLINRHEAPVEEPGLGELMAKAGPRLTATVDAEQAVHCSDVTFLLVPTPSEPDGSFSNAYMAAAVKTLAAALRNSDKAYHLFVVSSTVSPGTTDEILIPLIEQESGRKLNAGFGVCYKPEFIALGNLIKDIHNPDLVLIGESDSAAGEQLAEIFGQVCENQPYVARMSIVSAEITKISLNSYVTMKISFANTLSNICENIPSADIDDITQALGADRRISPSYLKGGSAFGGPCFPRDNRAFMAFAKGYGREAKLAEATDAVNEYQMDHLTELVLDNLLEGEDRKVSVLGQAYKANTPVIEESTAVKLIKRLLNKEVAVTVYDPLAMDNTKQLFGKQIDYAYSVRECVAQSRLWVVTTPLEEFKALDDSFVSHNPTTIIDCWRLLDPSRFSDGVNYLALGKST